MDNQQAHLVPLGIIMIIIQVIGCIASGNWGLCLSFASLGAFYYSLSYFVGHWALGIFGLIFTLIGLFSKPRALEDDDDDWD